MTDESNISPYGSAYDLPSVQEIAQQIADARKLRFLFPEENRQLIAQLEHRLQHFVETVDTFYVLLGERNWVFHDNLNLSAMEQLVAADQPEVAEKGLISYYQEDGRIKFLLRRLQRFVEMRPRIHLLQKALLDYEAHRYYSTVLVILSVVDGFVNDIDKAQRRGLHARSQDEMVAWDSVVGHHMGLSHAIKPFHRTFRKIDDSEVTELFRNGIVHGMLVNFDNEIVATKAWNLLFAVGDWADSRKLQTEQAKPTSSLEESSRLVIDNHRQKQRLEQWTPHSYIPDTTASDRPDIVRTCENFLESWKKQQWGLVASCFMQIGTERQSVNKLAVVAKDLFQASPLFEWKILEVAHTVAAVALIQVELLINDRIYSATLRWVRVDSKGKVAAEWEPGNWTLSPYAPSSFLNSKPKS